MNKNYIRIFISSTFNDFTIERNILNTHVFPKLQAYCRMHDISFQTIDLRWGISEAAASSHETIKICLNEIERCQNLSSKPNFFLLVGNRFGWQPLVPEISLNVAKEILHFFTENLIRYNEFLAVDLFDEFYKLDNNSIPPQYILQSTESITNVQEKTNKLIDFFRYSVDKINLSPSEKQQFYLSATGFEIARAIENFGESDIEMPHVVCFLREIEDIYDHVDVDNTKNKEIIELREKLKNRFTQFSYNLPLGKKHIKSNYSKWFEKQAEQVLKNVVNARIKEILALRESLSPSEIENSIHREFAYNRRYCFIGRKSELLQVKNYISHPKNETLVVYGPGGVGKSAFAAKCVENFEKDHGTETLYIIRFAGASASSTDSSSLIHSICEEICEKTNNKAKIPKNYSELCSFFKNLVRTFDKNRKLVILIDAVDQLENSQGENPLAWLINKLPDNVACIIVTLDGEFVKTAYSHLEFVKSLRIPPLEQNNFKVALEQLLQNQARRLTIEQEKYVVEQCEKTGLALYLKIALEKIKHWTSYFSSYSLESNLENLILEHFNMLARNENHGKVITENVLAYIALTYQGVTEEEILNLLSADSEVMQDFETRFPNSPKVKKLPFIVWSRIHADLASFLKEVDIDNHLHLQFYHRIIGVLVREKFLAEDFQIKIHEKLSRYFGEQQLWHGRGQSIPNQRKLQALPYHLKMQGNTKGLQELLCQESFLKAKIATGQLQDYLQNCTWLFSKQNDQENSRIATKIFINMIAYNKNKRKNSIDFDEVHALSIYSPSQNFHNSFFEIGSNVEKIRELIPDISANLLEKVHIKFLSARINYFRRLAMFDKAKEMINELLPKLNNSKFLREHSLLLYDLGYIEFLKGDYNQSYETLIRSAKSAQKVKGDASESSAMISRCVAYNVRSIGYLFTDKQDIYLEEQKKLLEEALPIFMKYQKENRHAKRWLANIYGQRANIAFYQKDLKQLKLATNSFRNDPWVKEYALDNVTGLDTYDACIYVLEKKYDKAIECLERYIRQTLQGINASESISEALARPYLHLGQCYKDAKQLDKAKSTWETALKFKDEYGNIAWKKEIKKRLTAL